MPEEGRPASQAERSGCRGGGGEVLTGLTSLGPGTACPSWDRDMARAQHLESSLGHCQAAHAVPKDTPGLLSCHYRNRFPGSPRKVPEPRRQP